MKNTEVVKKFGLKIKFEREKLGFSQEEFAYKSELSKNFIGKVERGEANPSLTSIHALARGLNMPVEELINPKNIEL